jgi:hypothetical protein
MSGEQFALEDQLARLLTTTRRGMTVKRMRTLLRAGGSSAAKADVVRALNGLRERGLAQFDYSQSWHRVN